MAAVPNPTGVSTFTGRSDDAKGAAVFENLWQGGAFDSQNPKEAAELQEGRRESAAQEAALRGEPEAREQREPPAREKPDLKVVPQAEEAAEPVAAEAEEGPEFSDLDDYLTKSQIDRNSFLELPLTLKVDGQSERVKLSDLVRTAQLDRHVQSKSLALAEQQRAFEAERQGAVQLLQTQLSQAQALGNLAKNQLLEEFKQINWPQLEVDDPGRWAALQQKFNQKAVAIDQHLANVQNHQSTLAQQAEGQRLAQLPKERELMLEARPEWRDEKAFQAARTQMVSHAKSLGFSDADIASITDHRQMLALDQAARYAADQARIPAALKKVRAAPQVSTPGARITRDPQRVAATQTKEAWKKSGYRDQSAGAAYFETLAN